MAIAQICTIAIYTFSLFLTTTHFSIARPFTIEIIWPFVGFVYPQSMSAPTASTREVSTTTACNTRVHATLLIHVFMILSLLL